jgi:prepilin-type processing-associated H-X9-DG protein
MRFRQSTIDREERAFSRVDLICAMAIVLMLGGLQLGSASQNVVRTKSAVCSNNLRELIVGWLAYADDNRGELVHNPHGGDSIGTTSPWQTWTRGWVSWETSSDNTNTLNLTNATYAKLAPYVRPDASIYKCPEDQYISATQARRGYNTRVRSYSMSFAMGDGNDKRIFDPSAVIFKKLADIETIKPEDAIVFVEEHPDSINDPVFFTSIREPRWLDLPASFHQGGAIFPFADGHVQRREWQVNSTLQAVKLSTFTTPPINSSNSDWRWMSAHSTFLR